MEIREGTPEWNEAIERHELAYKRQLFACGSFGTKWECFEFSIERFRELMRELICRKNSSTQSSTSGNAQDADLSVSSEPSARIAYPRYLRENWPSGNEKSWE